MGLRSTIIALLLATAHAKATALPLLQPHPDMLKDRSVLTGSGDANSSDGGSLTGSSLGLSNPSPKNYCCPLHTRGGRNLLAETPGATTFACLWVALMSSMCRVHGRGCSTKEIKSA